MGSPLAGDDLDAVCVACDSSTISERPERTTKGYRRFRCRTCGKQFKERSGRAEPDPVSL
jgi:transposase-like protein